MYSLSILYKIWTNACSCYGLDVRKRNCRWWAGQTAKNWRKPWFFLTTWDIATNWTYDSSLQTFIGCHGEKQWKCGGGGGRKQRNVVVVMVVGLPPFQTVPFSQKCQLFRFEHLFTSMIGGMASSGKTAWVRSLLQQACKLQRQFTLHQRELCGVIHNGSLHIQKC